MDKAATPMQLFEQVWKQTKSSFHSASMNNKDWVAIGQHYRAKVKKTEALVEALPIINDMLARLETSHTRLISKEEPAYYQLLDIFRGRSLWPEIQKRFNKVSYPGIGIFTQSIGDKLFVSGIIDGGPAHGVGLQVGDEILSLDGFSFHPINSFIHKTDTSVILQVRSSQQAESRQISLSPKEISPYRLFASSIEKSATIREINGSKIGYIRIWCYAHPAYQQQLVDILEKGKLKAADALVLDLRGGWGGADPAYLSLFSKKIPKVMLQFRNGKTKRLLDKNFSKPKFRWKKPVCLLVDKRTRSGKEVFAYAFKEYGIGPVIGGPTAGAVIGGTAFFMAEDHLLYLAVASLTCDGKILEGNPIEPDVFIPQSLPYSQGRDPRLQCALQLMARSVIPKK